MDDKELKSNVKKILDILVELDKKIEIQEERQGQLKRIVLDHEKFIDGNGRDGVKVRLDRVERMNRLISKVSWATIIGIIGLLIKMIIGELR